MYIENIWGVFFCMYLPIVIVTILAYLVGREEGRRYERINRVQHRKGYSKNNYAKKTIRRRKNRRTINERIN